MTTFKAKPSYILITLTPSMCQWIQEHMSHTLWVFRDHGPSYRTNVPEEPHHIYAALELRRVANTNTHQLKLETFQALLDEDVVLTEEHAKIYLLTYLFANAETACKYVETIEVYDIQDQSIPSYNGRYLHTYHV